MTTPAPPITAPAPRPPGTCEVCDEIKDGPLVPMMNDDTGSIIQVCDGCAAMLQDAPPEPITAARVGTCPFCTVDRKASAERVLEPHTLDVDGVDKPCPGSRCTVPASRCW